MCWRQEQKQQEQKQHPIEERGPRAWWRPGNCPGGTGPGGSAARQRRRTGTAGRTTFWTLSVALALVAGDGGGGGGGGGWWVVVRISLTELSGMVLFVLNCDELEV